MSNATARRVTATVAVVPSTPFTRPVAHAAAALDEIVASATAGMQQPFATTAQLARIAASAGVAAGQTMTESVGAQLAPIAATAGVGSGLPVDWTAGQVLPSATVFSGPAGRLARDGSGLYQSFGVNIPRYTVGGTFATSNVSTSVPAWIFDAPSSNLALGSATVDATNLHWQLNTWFTITAVLSCIAGQTAYLHVGDGTHTSANRYQAVGTYAAGQVDCYYAILEKGTAATSNVQSFDGTAMIETAGITLNWATMTATLDAGKPGGSQAGGVVRLGTGPNGGALVLLWMACSGTAGNIRRIAVAPNELTAGTNGTIVHLAQLEPGVALPSAPIVTTGSSVSRSAEQAYLPFTNAPGALTIYTKFVTRGAVQKANARVWQIGDGSTNTNSLRLIGTGRNLSVINDDGTASVSSSTPLDAAAFGDEIEVAARLYSDGSVDVLSAINGVDSTAGPRSAAKTLPSSWGGQRLYIACNGAGNQASLGLESIKVAVGVNLTMAQMRAFV